MIQQLSALLPVVIRIRYLSRRDIIATDYNRVEPENAVIWGF